METTGEASSKIGARRRRHRSTISSDKFDSEAHDLIEQWEALSAEIDLFEQKHKIYLTKLQEIEHLKKEHGLEFHQIQSKISKLKELIDIYKSLIIIANDDDNDGKSIKNKSELLRIRHDSEKRKETPEERRIRLNTIYEHLMEQRSNYLKRIQYTLPQPPETYLRIILGSELPVSILDKSQQWKYKEKYEEFKLRITLIIMILSFVMLTIVPVNGAIDVMFHFLLVWYYCTLTIRESILVANGSQIPLWWRLHHFIATICTSIILIWSSTQSYKLFRQQHYSYILYLSFVQVLLYYYQRGLLYRLRALGDSDELQITIEGFHLWMLRGLTFLAPFLAIGYILQGYNCYTLYLFSLDKTVEPTFEWRIVLKGLAFIYLILVLGNSLTIYIVFRRKFRQRIADIQWFKHRYENFKKLIVGMRLVKSI